ncbi:MAG: hypothetical protein H7X89_13420 [Rhizobiales bacterium]|nr:hypothetical protein [Hyphomicrobiales bacterium]
MSNPIIAPALAEHLRDDSQGSTKEARLAAFARLNLSSPKDIQDFIRNQEAACAARTSMYWAD